MSARLLSHARLAVACPFFFSRASSRCGHGRFNLLLCDGDQSIVFAIFKLSPFICLFPPSHPPSGFSQLCTTGHFEYHPFMPLTPSSAPLDDSYPRPRAQDTSYFQLPRRIFASLSFNRLIPLAILRSLSTPPWRYLDYSRSALVAPSGPAVPLRLNLYIVPPPPHKTSACISNPAITFSAPRRPWRFVVGRANSIAPCMRWQLKRAEQVCRPPCSVRSSARQTFSS